MPVSPSARQPDGTTISSSTPDYWNMIGPFGGITAAATLNAVMQHPQRLGAPISLNFRIAWVCRITATPPLSSAMPGP